MSRLNDLYTQITQQIITQLETGVRPWLKPWNAQHAAGPISRPLRHNAIPYSGINILLLWSTAAERGYLSPYWLTFKQAKELGVSEQVEARRSSYRYPLKSAMISWI